VCAGCVCVSECVKIESSFDFWLYLINPSFDFFETSDFFGMRGAKFKSQLHRTKKNCSLVIKPHTLKNNSSENVARERQRERWRQNSSTKQKKKLCNCNTHTHARAKRGPKKIPACVCMCDAVAAVLLFLLFSVFASTVLSEELHFVNSKRFGAKKRPADFGQVCCCCCCCGGTVRTYKGTRNSHETSAHEPFVGGLKFQLPESVCVTAGNLFFSDTTAFCFRVEEHLRARFSISTALLSTT